MHSIPLCMLTLGSLLNINGEVAQRGNSMQPYGSKEQNYTHSSVMIYLFVLPETAKFYRYKSLRFVCSSKRPLVLAEVLKCSFKSTVTPI